MPEPAENYLPQTAPSRFRSQAIRVWAILAAVCLIWILLILAPSILASTGANAAASSIFNFFGYICHQMPDRSFHLLGHQFGVCSRCFGVYFGLLVGMLIYPLWRRIDDIEPLPRIWLFLSLVPIGIDWSLTAFSIWENTYLSRFIAGLILGIACATFIVPAIVEITRHLSKRTFVDYSS